MKCIRCKSYPLLLCGFLLLISSVVSAGTLVKSVDEEGNVTYSDKPVSNAKAVTTIPIDAGPSASAVEAAEQKAKQNIDAVKEVDRLKEAEAEKAAQKKQAENKQPAAVLEEERRYVNTTPIGVNPYRPRPKPGVGHPERPVTLPAKGVRRPVQR